MICYTIITNDYDTLKDPKVISKDWKYVCLSDQPVESDVWEYRHICCNNREPKIEAHEYFEELTLYVDGSIEIIGDLNQFITEVPTWFSIWRHPHRNCTFEEADAVINQKGISKRSAYDQMERYAMDGFPRNFGLGANGIMLRDLSDWTVWAICDLWWEEWERGAKRDQLGLMYSFWKLGYEPDLFDDNIMNKYFKWGRHV